MSCIVEFLESGSHGQLRKCKFETDRLTVEIGFPVIAKGLTIAHHVNESDFVRSLLKQISLGQRTLNREPEPKELATLPTVIGCG